jgi:hypothetical protein
LIEKTILAQTEDQYPFATVYEQEISIYSFNQHSLTNEQWYERFNTKIDVGSAIGVTQQHRVLLEHVAAENGGATSFDELDEVKKNTVNLLFRLPRALGANTPHRECPLPTPVG